MADAIPDLDELVKAYVAAFDAQMPGAAVREAWADRPLRAQYQAVLGCVRHIAPHPRHSDKFVEGYVDDLLTAALRDANGIAVGVAALRTQLEHPVTTRLYFPLDGITLTEADLNIGSIRLVQMDDASFEQLVVAPFAANMSRNPTYDETRGAAAIEAHRRRLAPLRGRPCVEIVTDRDLEGSFAVAEQIVDEVCDYLQVCLAALVPLLATNPVRWSTGIVQAWRWTFGESDGPKPRTNSNGTLAYGGPAVPFGAAQLEQLQKLRIDALGIGLGKPAATEYGRMLRRAVRWFAKGEREHHSDDRKLSYVTAVDLFFSRAPVRDKKQRRPRNVTQRFAEGMAFAVHDGLPDIVRFARFAAGIYADRSATSHEGSYSDSADETVKNFRQWTLELLATMAQKPYSTEAEVDAWLDERTGSLTDDEFQRLDDATGREAVERDGMLSRAADIVGMAASPLDERPDSRRRYALRQIIRDALRYEGRAYLLQLRPHAQRLLTAVQAAETGGMDTYAAALKALATLPWLMQAVEDRSTAHMI